MSTDQGGVLDVGLGRDVLEFEGQSHDAECSGGGTDAVRPLTALFTTGTKAGSGLVWALPPSDLMAELKASACWMCWPMVTVANLVTTALAVAPPM